MRTRTLSILAATLLLSCPVDAQNSTRKVRSRPSPAAAKCGTAVRWFAGTVDEAFAAAKKSGKPVFWYVPTVRRSPMDRKAEIDRYMMAGPFSWPSLIGLLNARYVPVRSVPPGDLASRFGLARMKFIEPGYLVFSSDGELLARRDQITTFHESWFVAPLANLAKVDVPTPEPTPAGKAFRAGVELFHAGETGKAIAQWEKVAADHPNDPLGWKAAAEAEGHGPFRRGFEIFGELAPGVFAQPSPAGTRAPTGVYSEAELRRRGLDFLCRMQLSNGGWEDSRYDFGGTDSLPNVYTACTALIAWALLEELHAKEPVGDRPRMEKVLRKAMAYLTDPSRTNEQDRDELIWAHVYRVYFFCRYLELRQGEGDAPVRAALREVVGKVFAMQPGTGCWFHEYPNPFVCAEVLLGLDRAGAFGVPLDDQKIAKGVKALKQCRSDKGGFSYGFSRRARAGVPGAAGRMPICELALLRFGASRPEDLHAAVDAGVKYHGLLDAVRKYDDHADRYGYGGFFFWFDMLGRVRAMRAVKDGARRQAFMDAQRTQIVETLPEIDGCFVDSHELGRTYGTAMALLCLAQLRA